MTQTPPNVLTGVFPENDALVLIGFEHEDIPYLDRVASIYDIRPREREYYNQLPDIQKPAFVNYVQGSRLLTGPKTLIKNRDDSFDGHDEEDEEDEEASRQIAAWEQLEQQNDPSPYLHIVEYAHKHPDPRRDERNYQLRWPELKRYQELESEEAKTKFAHFVFGCKVAYSELLNEGYEEDINDCYSRNGPEVDQFATIGMICLEKYATPHTRAAALNWQGSTADHEYQEHGVDRPPPSPTAGDIAHVNAHTVSTGMQGGWRFAKTLHQNKNSYTFHRIVHLYVRLDDKDNIIDRIAVKVQGSMTDEAAQRDNEEEYFYHKMLSDKNCPYIIKTYGVSLRQRPTPPSLGYIYTEYAAFGDLFTLLKGLFEDLPQLPEPFIWFVFRALLETVFVMHSGRVITWDYPDEMEKTIKNDKIQIDEDWEPLMNPDIKLMNVVLSDPGTIFPAYLTPKMLDFGLIKTQEVNWSRESRERGVGTPYIRPPEQMGEAEEKYKSEPLDVRSMIWNVAMIILSLMDRDFIPNETTRRRPTHVKKYRRVYSHALEQLVADSLQVDPKKRPQLCNLLYLTRENLERWEKAYGPVRGKSDGQVLPFCRLESRTKDEFKVGKLAPEHIRQAKKRKADNINVLEEQPRKKPSSGAQKGTLTIPGAAPIGVLSPPPEETNAPAALGPVGLPGHLPIPAIAPTQVPTPRKTNTPVPAPTPRKASSVRVPSKPKPIRNPIGVEIASMQEPTPGRTTTPATSWHRATTVPASGSRSLRTMETNPSVDPLQQKKAAATASSRSKSSTTSKPPRQSRASRKLAADGASSETQDPGTIAAPKAATSRRTTRSLKKAARSKKDAAPKGKGLKKKEAPEPEPEPGPGPSPVPPQRKRKLKFMLVEGNLQ
ncbi:kinase-like protein [Corynespora cassiicola Philippines]|uniref:non-specific serine/threonine protein kinase n=1 Tax=Corynespora cassiicola Philippines TaxID=1448308 RepID=A0A2T2P869_CORCC|nr:kinase-like protein [Corynespora cassiicola Philippines]